MLLQIKGDAADATAAAVNKDVVGDKYNGKDGEQEVVVVVVVVEEVVEAKEKGEVEDEVEKVLR